MHARNFAATLLLVFATTLSGAVQAGLINGSFEDPVFSLGVASVDFPATIPGWQTTDQSFEIWSDGFTGVTSFDGNQHAELNAFINGTLFQDVTSIGAGAQVGFEFAHRGRAGTDTMRLTITDLGVDDLAGGGNDTVLFTDIFSTGNTAWVFYDSASEAPILALGNTLRFAYIAVTSVGGLSFGNFLDAADFGAGVGGVPGVPEPATWLLLGAGLSGLGFTRRRKKRFN